MTRFQFGMLMLLAAASLAGAKERTPACEPDLLAEVQLRITPGGNVFMPASIGGQQVFFQLSIGTGWAAMQESAVKYIGLKPKPRVGGAEMSAGGRPITHYVLLENAQIGGFKLLDRAAPVLPQPGVEAPVMLDGKPIVGTMGSTLLRNVDAELYLAESRLKLFKPFSCLKGSPVYWEGEVAELPMRFDAAGTLIFTLELDGKKVEAGLLAGGRISNIDVNATRQFFGFDETSPGVESVRSQNEDPDSLFHAMSLTGQGLKISDTKVRLRRGSDCKLASSANLFRTIGYDDCINVVPFNIGTDLLSQMRIYISRKRMKVYVSTVAGSSPKGSGTVTIAPVR